MPDSVGDITFAPGDTKGPYQVSSSTVSSDLLVELLANPDGIIYSIPSPSLVNPTTSQSYAVVGQNVQAQTAGITVDDGSGNPATYLVATNVARKSDGSAAGINVKAALDSIVQLDYGTCQQTNPDRQVLCRVGQVETTDEYHFWSLLTSDDLPIGSGDFDQLQLTTGSVLRMVYLVDADQDGLYDPQENLYGTDLDNADTDDDGLTDYAETQTGWTVPAIGPQKAYQIYPSPLSSDLDGDASPTGATAGQRPADCRLMVPKASGTPTRTGPTPTMTGCWTPSKPMPPSSATAPAATAHQTWSPP